MSSEQSVEKESRRDFLKMYTRHYTAVYVEVLKMPRDLLMELWDEIKPPVAAKRAPRRIEMAEDIALHSVQMMEGGLVDVYCEKP